jgi:hypothetical protein
MGEDIISVAFLALFAIIISCIMASFLPTVAVMPTMALIAVCLWVAYDYMLRRREEDRKKQKPKKDDLDKKIRDLTDELEIELVEMNGPVPRNEDDNVRDKEPQAKHKNEFDIKLYNDKVDYKSMFAETGCTGDNRMANRMKYMGMQDRVAQNIRSKWNAEKFRPYVEEELRAGESRDWWDSEADYLDALM